MADKTYTIPLRREFIRVPKYRKAKRAIHAVQNFLVQHTKATVILIGPALNHEIWKNGIRNPPARVKVNVSKDDKGVVRAELVGAPAFVEKVKAEEKKGVMQKIAETVTTPAKKEKQADKTEKSVPKPVKLKKTAEDTAPKSVKPEVKESETAIKAELERLEKKTAAVKTK